MTHSFKNYQFYINAFCIQNETGKQNEATREIFSYMLSIFGVLLCLFNGISILYFIKLSSFRKNELSNFD